MSEVIIYKKSENKSMGIKAYYRQIGDEILEIKQQHCFVGDKKPTMFQLWIEKIKTDKHHLNDIEGLEECTQGEFSSALASCIFYLQNEFKK